jgi:hypothetical protein
MKSFCWLPAALMFVGCEQEWKCAAPCNDLKIYILPLFSAEWNEWRGRPYHPPCLKIMTWGVRGCLFVARVQPRARSCSSFCSGPCSCSCSNLRSWSCLCGCEFLGGAAAATTARRAMKRLFLSPIENFNQHHNVGRRREEQNRHHCPPRR